MVDNFCEQWLTSARSPASCRTSIAYPEFDENLRDAFRQETLTVIGSQLREIAASPIF
jgi:hypothetical protein